MGPAPLADAAGTRAEQPSDATRAVRTPGGARRRLPARIGRVDLFWAGGVGAVLIAVDVVLWAYLRRPFWYDEIWRGHFVSEPLSSLWSELAHANTPSAAGWVIMERLGGDVLGWHTWVLRLPGFVALPLLGIGIVLLTARFTGPVVAAFAGLWICLNSTLLDLGTQLKPYTVETLAAVVAVLLWIAGERGTTPTAGIDHVSADADATVGEVPAGGGRHGSLDRGRLIRRTLAGLVSLFSVPAVFLIVPLAAVDIVAAAVRARHTAQDGTAQDSGVRRAGTVGVLVAGGWRTLEALPAVVLAGANTLLFVGHQSSQRLGHYWDAQFLAGRGFTGGLAFIGRQLRDVVTGTPPGIDRYDPSLLHSPTDGTWVSLWLFAPAVVVCGLAGAAVLARRHDGRLVLAALGGAQLAMLAASAVRFWPFGPTRTNLFLVPLIVLVVVAGASDLVGRLIKIVRGGTPTPGRVVIGQLQYVASGGGDQAFSRQWLGERLGLTAVAVALVTALGAVGASAQVSSAARDDRLYDQRDRLRGLDLTVDAAVAARRLYQPGDLVVVGGRLLRPGWIYAMEASDDAPRRPASLPARGAADEPARVPRADTLFFSALGTGQVVRAVMARVPAPRRLLLVIFDLDEAATRPDLADLRHAGWCPEDTRSFPQTGTLTTLARCR